MSPFDAALPSTEDLFSVIEAIHDNVAIVDHNGVMRWVSSCFERNYGISRDRVIGRTTYELEAEKVFSPSVAALVLKTRRVVTLTEATRSGQYNIVTGVPIYDDDGDVSFVVSYSVDMRYSRRLHEEYQKISALVSPNAPQTSGGLPFSGTMRAIAATIEKLAKVNTTVLITGESGVGKNVVARLVHHLSDRTNGPLVEINCAGIPAPLLESELFGYEAGAFTGASHKGKEGRIALADKGTLFLDEIGELPLRLQSKLLQVIQEKQIVKLGGVKPVSIDFRLVAATNQDLEALVEKKRFRSDLFFRLNVLPLWIPPLRERREEIVPLCLSILGEMNAKYGTEKVFSDEVKRHLAAYSWPGNIRELRNVSERLVIVSSGGVIKADELPEHMFRHQENQESPIGKSLPDALETLERRMILEAYKACGTTTGVAKALGISQPTAARKIAKYKNEASGER